jgi:AcrR family transcriptional regulator
MAAAPATSAVPVRRSRLGRAVLGEFQRSRLLAAALAEVSQRGIAQTTASHVVARARVSRTTFYEIFDDREDCLAALFEEAVSRLARVAVAAYASEGSWAQRLRRALEALLAFLETERDLGAFALACLVGEGSIDPRLRARVLEQLRGVIENGRRDTGPRGEPWSLTAELVVAGVLAVVHARLRARSPRLGELLNPLMWTIVLPYLGPAAAARELRRPPPRRAVARPKPARGALEGLGMRVTYRTSMVLQAIAEQPGASNFEIAARAGVSDQGQISKLLARLAGLGLAENTGAHSLGATNAWCLTTRGGEVVAELTRRFATAAPARGRRRGG